MSSRQAIDIVSLETAQNNEGAAGEPDVDQRFLGAESEAAGGGEPHIAAALMDGFREGVEDAFRAVAVAAGAHAHGDAGPARQ